MNVEIKIIHDSMGVFATQPINKGEVLFKLTPGQLLQKPTKYSIQVGVNQHLEHMPEDFSEQETPFFWRYLNHSCAPNIAFFPVDTTFRAIDTICADEELRFNYLTNEYDMATPFKCNCGAVNCFKNIKGFRYLNDAQKVQMLPFANEHIRVLYMREAVLG